MATMSLSMGEPLPVPFLIVAYLIPFAVLKTSGLVAAMVGFGAMVDATRAIPAALERTSRRVDGVGMFQSCCCCCCCGCGTERDR